MKRRPPSAIWWRSVHRAHVAAALTGEGAAAFPGRYNALGVRAVYLADCPAGCALELLASYAAPEAIATHVLLEVEVPMRLIDIRAPGVARRYRTSLGALTAPSAYEAARALGARLRADGHAGAVVPAATVAAAANAVVFPEFAPAMRVRSTRPLALDRRLTRLLTET